MSRPESSSSTLIRTVAPSASNLAVTLDEFKEELGIFDDTSLDPRLMRLIRQATKKVETDARRIVMTQTWQMFLDEFPCGGIELRKVPVQSLTHIKYYIGGSLETLSSALYQTDLISHPARIYPVLGQIWPTVDCSRLNAVQIEWVAGYTSAAVVPDDIKAAILAAAVQMYYGCEPDENYSLMISGLQRFGFTR
jgi:uncharacterized phiE125 gp8 family phage protein